jgi:hypothetical protein
MKKLLLVLSAAGLVACMHDQNQKSGSAINEPAGAQLSTNSMQPSMQQRDINQQPYPGASDLNQQRGTESTSSSSLEGSSGSSTLNSNGTTTQKP